MRALAALCLIWAAYALLLLWLTYQPWPLTFVWPTPSYPSYDDYSYPYDPWTGGFP